MNAYKFNSLVLFLSSPTPTPLGDDGSLRLAHSAKSGWAAGTTRAYEGASSNDPVARHTHTILQDLMHFRRYRFSSAAHDPERGYVGSGQAIVQALLGIGIEEVKSEESSDA